MALADVSQFKAPPSTRSTKTASTRKAAESSASTGRIKSREDAVNGVFQLAGFGCIIMKQYADAGAIAKHGEKIAHEAALLAESNESMGKALDYIMEAGPYAGLITACMPLVLQLAANHKLVKAEFVAGAGVESPEALSARIQADMAEQALLAFQAQQEAERKLTELQAQTGATTAPGSSENPNGSSPA